MGSANFSMAIWQLLYLLTMTHASFYDDAGRQLGNVECCSCSFMPFFLSFFRSSFDVWLAGNKTVAAQTHESARRIQM